jgi:hypothetical protein
MPLPAASIAALRAARVVAAALLAVTRKQLHFKALLRAVDIMSAAAAPVTVILQARWRGYQVRKRWADQEGRLAFVEEQKAKHQAEQLHQQRLRELEQKLQARRAKQQAQATAAAVAAAEEGGSTGEAAVQGSGGVAAAGVGVSVAGASRAASAARRMPGSRVMSAAVGGKANKPWSGKAR